jgi:hypothetical protein
LSIWKTSHGASRTTQAPSSYGRSSTPKAARPAQAGKTTSPPSVSGMAFQSRL